MNGDDAPNRSESERLPPKTLTERVAEFEVGDRIRINERDAAYEVVATDRYSVTVVDPEGNRLSLSQNLQSGGWTVNEAVRRVERVESEE